MLRNQIREQNNTPGTLLPGLMRSGGIVLFPEIGLFSLSSGYLADLADLDVEAENLVRTYGLVSVLAVSKL